MINDNERVACWSMRQFLHEFLLFVTSDIKDPLNVTIR